MSTGKRKKQVTIMHSFSEALICSKILMAGENMNTSS